MRTATIAEAKEKLEELIAAARAGEQVEITEAGKAVAALVPETGSSRHSLSPDEWEARMAELEARGLVSRPKSSPEERAAALAWLLDNPLPAGNSGVLDALLEERRTGR